MYNWHYKDAFIFFVFIGLLFVIMLFYYKWKKRKFNLLAESHLLNHLLPDYSKGKFFLKTAIVFLSLVLLVLAIANLQVGDKIEKTDHIEAIDVFLVIDISNSMLAEDLLPSRLERAKHIARQIVQEIYYARFGIILFAGDAFIHLPTTIDKSAILMFIQNIETNLISIQGTAIGRALDLAANAFERVKSKNKAIILISDGENFEDDALAAISTAIRYEIPIYTIVLGSPRGAPIPIKEKNRIIGYKKDKNNQIVITTPDFNLLSAIASRTGGIFIDGNTSPDITKKLNEKLQKLEREESQAIEFSEWRSIFQIFAIPALILLIADFILTWRRSKWQQTFDKFRSLYILKNKF